MNNISYELALELKNAGFPQGRDESYICEFNDETKEEDCAYTPPLEELIEACGDIHMYCSEHTKRVTSISPLDVMKPYDGRGGENYNKYWQNFEEADTLEEALAKLWLKFNKK